MMIAKHLVTITMRMAIVRKLFYHTLTTPFTPYKRVC